MAFNERYSIARRKMIKQEFNYKSKKLFSTFLRRTRYTTHYRNVKAYMKLGMQAKKFIMLLNFDKLL